MTKKIFLYMKTKITMHKILIIFCVNKERNMDFFNFYLQYFV